MAYNWFRTALFNLLIAGSLGAVLRFAFVAEIPDMNFRYVLHAHSHVAMLGWVYLALYAFAIPAFLPQDKARAPYYRWLFWLTQFTVAGMLLSFPFQGYGAVSIAFSTAHILLSYAFVLFFSGDLPREDRSLSRRFIRSSLGFMVLSTLGIWAMGPVMSTGLKAGPLYILVVQFFLHFQFFGWFLFAVMGLFLRWMEEQGYDWPEKEGRRFFGLMVAGSVLTFALPLTWWKASGTLFAVNGLGVLLLGVSAWLFYQGIRPIGRELSNRLLPQASFLFGVAFWTFLLMVLMRLGTLVPAMAVMSYTLRNFTIGFLHLVLLGVITPFLFAYAAQLGYIRQERSACRWGIRAFLAGMILSEFLLFGQGVLLWAGAGFIPAYYELLFGLSALMPLGFLMMFYSSIATRLSQPKKEEPKALLHSGSR